MTTTDQTTTVNTKPKSSKLWLWIVAAIVLQLVAWTIWFMIAAHHKVEEVPLVSQSKVG